jgi:hypothetical protein
MRATSAEAEKKIAIENHIKDKEQTVNKLLHERQLERQQLENNIQVYRQIIDQKQIELDSLTLSLQDTQNKKLELENIQNKLKFAVQDLEARNKEDNHKYQSNIGLREQLAQQQLTEVKHVSDVERGRLIGDINSLEHTLKQKEQRLQATSQDANLYRSKYQVADSLEKQRQIEIQQWKTTANNLAVQKEIEVQNQLSQRVQEVS